MTRTKPEGAVSAPVIYPSHLKYDQSRRMPYLALLDRLRAFLRRSRAIVVTCGYSFRDAHLNEVLADGAASNSGGAVFGLQFGPMSNYPVGEALAKIRPNLSLLATDRAVVGGVTADWSAHDEVPVGTDATAITWSEADGKHVPEFQLGNFHVLGNFLADVVGRSDRADATAGEAKPVV